MDVNFSASLTAAMTFSKQYSREIEVDGILDVVQSNWMSTLWLAEGEEQT